MPCPRSIQFAAVVLLLRCPQGSSFQRALGGGVLRRQQLMSPDQVCSWQGTVAARTLLLSTSGDDADDKPREGDKEDLDPKEAILPSSNDSADDQATPPQDPDELFFASEEDKKEAVGNLVADDEWMGLSMELSEVIRLAVVEDMKTKTRDFIGKDDYAVGDISKEIDSRVKDEVARMRGKEEYELGDFVMAMDEMSKTMTEDLTGKPYEAGDLSVYLDTQIKDAVAKYCGKDEYEFGDLTREVSRRVQDRVEEFTGKPYEFGDVSRVIEARRKAWVEDFLGEEAAANYQFGDITKKMVSQFTGKDEYEFGDISKKLFRSFFGKKKQKGDNDDDKPAS